MVPASMLTHGACIPLPKSLAEIGSLQLHFGWEAQKNLEGHITSWNKCCHGSTTQPFVRVPSRQFQHMLRHGKCHEHLPTPTAGKKKKKKNSTTLSAQTAQSSHVPQPQPRSVDTNRAEPRLRSFEASNSISELGCKASPGQKRWSKATKKFANRCLPSESLSGNKPGGLNPTVWGCKGFLPPTKSNKIIQNPEK